MSPLSSTYMRYIGRKLIPYIITVFVAITANFFIRAYILKNSFILNTKKALMTGSKLQSVTAYSKIHQDILTSKFPPRYKLKVKDLSEDYNIGVIPIRGH